MATYTLKNKSILLTSTAAQLVSPGAVKARYNLVRAANLGVLPCRIWLWRLPTGSLSVTHQIADLRNDGLLPRVHADRDVYAIAAGYPMPPKKEMEFALSPVLGFTSDELWGMTSYAKYGIEAASTLTTAEIIVAAGAGLTYTATTVTDTGAAYTVSAANGDLVGRRVEAGTAFLIVTSNTATVVTGTDGWRDVSTGMPYVNPNNGNLFPTTGGGGMGYTVLASMRDTTQTATTQDAYAGHLLVTGAFNARRTVTLVGNSAGVVTYGTTFQAKSGGWPTGLPTAGKDWRIDGLVRVMLDWIEEA